MALQNEHTLLLVDDERSITRALQRLFRKEGYHILTADSGQEGLDRLQRSEETVSLIISDQRMPQMNGAQFLEKAKEIYPDAIRYLLTGYSDLEAVIQAVNKGEIHRYLTKPWNDDDLLLQVRLSLEHFELISENRRLNELTIAQNRELSTLNKNLEQKVQERTKEVYDRNKALITANQMLERSFMDSIRLLLSLVETLNPPLSRQMRQVAHLSREVAEAFELTKSELDHIEMAGLIHDIGLLGSAEDLWNKDTKQMSESQFRTFSEHPVIASVILENVEKLAEVGEIVLFHHEHINGQGFPNGLRGNAIPLGSRILLAVSDYCRITETWPRDLRKLMGMTRRHFDPSVWSSLTVSDDPEVIIQEAAEKKLLLGVNQIYDMEVVSALIKKVRQDKQIKPTHVIGMHELKAGMVLMEDLRLRDGRLLLTKGTKLKENSVQSIQSIAERGLISSKVTVSKPEDD